MTLMLSQSNQQSYSLSQNLLYYFQIKPTCATGVKCWSKFQNVTNMFVNSDKMRASLFILIKSCSNHSFLEQRVLAGKSVNNLLIDSGTTGTTTL